MIAKLLDIMNANITETKQSWMMFETLLYVQFKFYIYGSYINLRVGLQTMMETHVSLHIVTNTISLKLLGDISVKTLRLLFPPKPKI